MVKIGFIGCGGISHSHVQRLALLADEAEIQSLCDVNIENARKLAVLANKFRNLVPKPIGEDALYADYRRMLTDQSLDAVIVCTPHVYHYEHVTAALEKGLHVLVEKPMAISVPEAEAMKQKADEQGLVLAIGYQRHFQPEYVFARQLVKGGRIGQPHFILAWLTQDLRRAIGLRSWYLDPKLAGGGQLICSGTHLTDLVLWVADAEPVGVKAFIEQEGADVDMYTSLSAELSNGALANISILGDSPETSVREELRVWCSRGAVFVVDGKAYLQDKGENPLQVLPGNLPRVSPNPDVNFVRSVLGKEECLSSALHGLRATKLEQMAYANAAPMLNRLKPAPG